jgi:hypothetical protein
MSVRTFMRGVAVVLICLAGWGIYLLIDQWHEQTIAGLQVRLNAITGVVQVRNGGEWVTSSRPDPYAPIVAPADLSRIRIVDAAWGQSGLLVARALVAPGAPIRGRLIVTLNIIDTAGQKRIRERNLRANVDWPAGALTPFVLRTNLSAPVGKFQKTVITLQPSLSSGGTITEQ